MAQKMQKYGNYETWKCKMKNSKNEIWNMKNENGKEKWKLKEKWQWGNMVMKLKCKNEKWCKWNFDVHEMLRNGTWKVGNEKWELKATAEQLEMEKTKVVKCKMKKLELGKSKATNEKWKVGNAKNMKL